jgi:hypothetical protein
MLKKYSPKKINGGWNNVQFLGYMDGTFVEVEFAEDAVTTHVGAQGDVSVVLNANRLATVTVTFIQGADVNEELSKLVPDARTNSLPRGAFSLTDLNGTTVVSGKDAFIKKTAKIEFAKNITGRQWVFVIPEAEIFVGKGGD